ncbi:MAG: FAD-binding oxidoreductase [Hyphomonas sp.]|uniref:NAD(P)/FAD-dependent oxidoreductase n=1 Tax=Hyphomonas sp. TaxID=87 RepID=UPI0034A09089
MRRPAAIRYLHAAIARGARLYSPADVSDVEPSEARVVIHTRDGPDVRARHLVAATGYEMMKAIAKKANRIIPGWSIATRPQLRNIWPTAAMIREASDPYLYIRATSAGEVICGGEDEKISDADRRDARIADKTRTLARKLAALLPDIDAAPMHAWAGSFGDSPVGTPAIGRIPGMANCYAAMGYGGNRITFSMMAAQILRGMITGRSDPDSDPVSFYGDF